MKQKINSSHYLTQRVKLLELNGRHSKEMKKKLTLNCRILKNKTINLEVTLLTQDIKWYIRKRNCVQF